MLIKKEKHVETLDTINKCECWLCLRVTNLSDCVVFNEIHKEILEVLLANDVINSRGSVICNNCKNMLHKSFAFKSTCLYTEDSLTPFINSQKFSKLDIITVFCEVHKDKTKSLSKDSKVCRFCLKILDKVSYTFLKYLNELDLEMLKKVTPEVHLNAIKDPIICEVCLYCFRDVLEFINICLNSLKWCNNSRWTSLNSNSASIGANRDNLVSSEADSESSRESNDENVLNPNEIKWNPDFFESSDTTCLKIDHASDEESLQTFKCYVCDFISGNEKSLAVHRNIHNSSEIKLDNSEECTIQSEHKYNLTEHNLVLTEPVKVNLYKCQLCQFSTKHKRSIRRHQKMHESEEKNIFYKCQLCQFSTKHKGNLATHQKVHQPEEKNISYKCQLCQFSTKYKGSLATHKKVHEPEKKTIFYKCQLCDFSTKCKRGLRKHQVVHQNPEEANLYKCQLCQFSTKHRYSLARHQNMHKPEEKNILYKCHLCQFSTKHKRNLVAHQKVHNNIFYRCHLCQFTTKYRRSLKNHQVVHEKG